MQISLNYNINESQFDYFNNLGIEGGLVKTFSILVNEIQFLSEKLGT